MRELPVGDHDELGPRVHEVAGTGVALHEHDRPVAVGGAVVAQPRERQRDHGDAAAGLRVLGLPLDDLVEHVLADRPRRTELGQVERLGIEAVEQGQLLHELLRHRQLLAPGRRSGRSGSRPRRAASGTRARWGAPPPTRRRASGWRPSARYTAASRGSEYRVADCGPNPGSERSQSSTTLPSACSASIA